MPRNCRQVKARSYSARKGDLDRGTQRPTDTSVGILSKRLRRTRKLLRQPPRDGPPDHTASTARHNLLPRKEETACKLRTTIAITLTLLVLASSAMAQEPEEYQLLATNRTGTTQDQTERGRGARLPFRRQKAGETAF